MTRRQECLRLALAVLPLVTACAAGSAATQQADDSRGGQLVCRKGAETMQMDVPAGRLTEVRGLASRMGYSESDCVFNARR